MPTSLPTDVNSNVIPAMRLKSGGAHAIAATTTSARNATAFSADTKVISLYATAAVYVKFGMSGVTATNTDHYFPAGTYYDVAISGGDVKGPHNTHIAVMTLTGTGTVYISEKE